MSNSYPVKPLRPAQDLDRTLDYTPPSVPSASRARRCHIAGPGSAVSAGDIACVLRRRLLIAALIIATAFTVFFVRHLIEPETFFAFTPWHIVLEGGGAALFVLVCTLLASGQKLSVRQLRVVELVMFGALAAYFAYLQVMIMQRTVLAEWAKEGHLGDVLRLANATNALRWFVLTVTYGVLVPNTWKRCALFTGIWVAIPLVLTFAACVTCPVMHVHGLQALLDLLTLLAVGAAVAVFGSYKLSELQEKADKARRLGQYQLKELIGRGGMGEVYLAEHMMLRRACAIKLIRPEHSGDLTSMSRFEREVKAMARLTHWNAVEVYDYGLADDGTFYYVMEYLPGMSLQEIVDRNGPMPAARAIHFLRQVCDALQEAHSLGIIHRDIKPSNVLATVRGGIYDVAKLLDFGLVQCVGLKPSDYRLTMQGTVLGSPPYMSPEQALGKEDLDARTDIYSIGGLAYFLLTGHPAFERDTPMQVLMAHVYDGVTPPSELRPDIPPDLEEIILRCLEKDPAKRFPTAEALEEALAQCSAANQWTRRDAAEWWRTHLGEQAEAAQIA